MEEEYSSISKSPTSVDRKSEEQIFDDISNDALFGLDGMDVVDSWEEANSDNDDLNRSKQCSDNEKRQSPFIQRSSTDRSPLHQYDQKSSFTHKRFAERCNDYHSNKTRSDSRSKKYDKKEKATETRRDSSKTKRDIQKDKDRLAKNLKAKIIEKKTKGMENNVMNLDEYNMTEEKRILNDLEKQKSPSRKASSSTSHHRSPSYGKYRSSERFKDFRRIDRRSNVSRYSPDRYQQECHNYKSGYKSMSRSPSLMSLSSGSDISVRETWLANRQSKIRRSKSPSCGKRKPFIEEIKRQLEETSQFQEASQMINQVPPQPTIYPSGYQHFPPMQNNYQQPVINAPSVLPPMCPNPFANIPHPNMNIPHEMNAFNPNIRMSYPEIHVPPHEMNILPFNVRVVNDPSVLLQNQNSMQYLPNPDLICPNPTYSFPTFSNPPPIIRRNYAQDTRELIDTSTIMTTRPKSNEDKNTKSKHFQDKKIKMSNFLTATVISRCQDAIKNLSFDLNNPTRFVPTSLYSDIKKSTENNNKWLSPLEKIPTVSLPFSEDSDKKALVHDQLQKLLAKLCLPTLVVRDSPTSLPQSGTIKSNLSTKEVQTDSYKCQSQSIQTETSLTYDVGVQVNMDDILKKRRSRRRKKSILMEAPPPPVISQTARVQLPTSEPERKSRWSSISNVDAQAPLDSFTSNTPQTVFPNNQPNLSLFSYGNNSSIDLKPNDYSFESSNLSSTLNYNQNDSLDYSKNNQISPSSFVNFGTCPNPYEKSIPHPNINIPHSDMSMIYANAEINTSKSNTRMSSSETCIPPCENNILFDTSLQNESINDSKESKHPMIKQPLDVSNPLIITADDQRTDPEVRLIFNKIQNGDNIEFFTLHTGLLKRVVELDDGTTTMRIVVPEEQRNQVIKDSHLLNQSKHRSIDHTAKAVAVCYWWSSLYKDIVNYVRSCSGCSYTNIYAKLLK